MESERATWIPLREAVTLIADSYRAVDSRSEEQIIQVAKLSLMTKLASGRVRAKSSFYSDASRRSGDLRTQSADSNGIIPGMFWFKWLSSVFSPLRETPTFLEEWQDVDWVVGDFSIPTRDVLDSSHAQGVTISELDLYDVFGTKRTGKRQDRPKVKKRRPGPPPDPDWPAAIAKVTQDCIAAGYKIPIKRGDKAAIQTMLLSFMAEKDKHFSEDTAATHANKVIAALPDS